MKFGIGLIFLITLLVYHSHPSQFFISVTCLEVELSDLKQAADRRIITLDQVQELWIFINSKSNSSRNSTSSSSDQEIKYMINNPGLSSDCGTIWDIFTIVNILYVVSTLAVLTAMLLLAVSMWNAGNGIPGLIISFSYFVGFLLTGIFLKTISSSEFMGDILLTFSVLLVPPWIIALMIVLQSGVRRNITFTSPSGLIATLSELLASVIILAATKFPLLQAPFFVSLYFVHIWMVLAFAGAHLRQQKQYQLITYCSTFFSIEMIIFALIFPTSLLGNLRLGAMISSMNTLCWSLPYILLRTIHGKQALNQLQRLVSWDNIRQPRGGIQRFPLSVLTGLVIYNIINLFLLIFSIHQRTWIVLPYAVVGLVLSSLVKPPTWRWCVFSDLPLCIVLNVTSQLLLGITDETWMRVLAQLGNAPVLKNFLLSFLRAMIIVGQSIVLSASSLILWKFRKTNQQSAAVLASVRQREIGQGGGGTLSGQRQSTSAMTTNIVNALMFYVLSVWIADFSRRDPDYFCGSLFAISSAGMLCFAVLPLVNNLRPSKTAEITVVSFFIHLLAFQVVCGSGRDSEVLYYTACALVLLTEWFIIKYGTRASGYWILLSNLILVLATIPFQWKLLLTVSAVASYLIFFIETYRLTGKNLVAYCLIVTLVGTATIYLVVFVSPIVFLIFPTPLQWRPKEFELATAINDQILLLFQSQ